MWASVTKALTAAQLSSKLTRSIIGQKFYPATAAEVAAAVVPADYSERVIDVTRFGATGDGVTDDSAAIQAAMDVARLSRGRVHFPSRQLNGATVYCCASISVYEGTHVTADKGVVIEKNGGGAFTTHIFDCVSTLGTPTALTANTAKSDATVAVTSAAGLSVGQLVMIRDAQYKWATNGRNLELNEIADIAGLVVTLRNRLMGAYLTASAAELVPVTVPARGIKFEGVQCRVPVGEDGGAFYFQEAYDCDVIACGSVGQRGQAGVQTWRSAHIRVTGGCYSDGQDQATPGYGYGIAFAQSSHHCVARGVVTRNVRENACSVGSRFCGFIDCEAHSSYDNGFNTHADGNEDCFFENCRSYFARSKGFFAGGAAGQAPDKRIRFTGCESHFSGYFGFWIDGSSGVESEDVTLENCSAFHFGVSTALSYGFYAFRTKRARLVNCRAEADGAGANARGLVKFELSVDAVIRGGKFTGATSGWGILHENCTGVTIGDGVEIGNIGASQGVRAEGTASTGVVVRDVRVDNDTAFTFNTADIRERIIYATKRSEARGVASVANGATIAHGLVAAPVGVVVMTKTADRCIAANAFGASNFTVNINIRSSGAADATPQDVSWYAWT